MIAAVVAELQLVGLAAEGEADQLVAEADAEDRDTTHQAADVFLGVGAGLGVAGAVGEEDAVGLEGEHVFGVGFRGHDGDTAAAADQLAQDVVLDAEVVGDDVVLRLGVLDADNFGGLDGALAGVPDVALLGGDDLGEVSAVHLRNGAGFLDELGGIRFDGGDNAAHDAVVAQVADQGAGVDIGEDGDACSAPGIRRPPAASASWS